MNERINLITRIGFLLGLSMNEKLTRTCFLGINSTLASTSRTCKQVGFGGLRYA